MSTEHEPTLGQSLVTTLKHSDLKALASTAAELAIDSMLKDGLLKEIPVIRTLTNLTNIGLSVRDYVFTRKLLKFLASIGELKEDERQGLLARLEKDSKFQRTVGEHIILLLDRMDDLAKPTFMAKAFIAYCRGAIDFIQLQRLNNAIDKVLVCDLPQLKRFSLDDDSEKFDVDVEQNFVNSGLAYVQSGYGVGGVHPTGLCKVFLKCVLDETD
jgi:hypothetical protein